jgi:hypothetical protein
VVLNINCLLILLPASPVSQYNPLELLQNTPTFYVLNRHFEIIRDYVPFDDPRRNEIDNEISAFCRYFGYHLPHDISHLLVGKEGSNE